MLNIKAKNKLIFLFLLFLGSLLSTSTACKLSNSLRNALIDYRDTQSEKSIETITKQIRQGASPVCEYYGLSPLAVSLEAGNIALLQAIIETGIDLQSIDNDSRESGISLIQKIYYDAPESETVLRMLLENGASIEEGMDADSVFSSAVYEGNLGVVKLLIEHGFQLDTDFGYENTLYRVAERGNLEILSYLNSAGFEAEDKRALVKAAISSNNPEVIEYSMERDYIRGNDAELFEIASLGILDKVDNSYERTLKITNIIKARTGFDPPPGSFDTLVYLAALYRDKDALKYAIENGGNANHVYDGSNALAEVTKISIMETLATTNNYDLYDGTINRHLQLESDLVEMADLLLANGANPDLTDKHGMTPLMWSADPNKIKLAQLLLSYGAAASLTNKEGKTALDFLKQREPVKPGSIDKNGRRVSALLFGVGDEYRNLMYKRYLSLKSKLEIYRIE